ncbi:hypothetical protein GCM10010520_60260 [Rhizobium viscosum]
MNIAPIRFTKIGRELRLIRTGYEGGVVPEARDGWYWWLRTSAGRFAGSAGTIEGAKSSLGFVIHKIENGEDPTWRLV